MSDAEAGLPVTRLQPEPLLQALVAAAVEFVIIGGFSLDRPQDRLDIADLERARRAGS